MWWEEKVRILKQNTRRVLTFVNKIDYNEYNNIDTLIVSCPNQMLAATLFAGYKCIGVQMLLATLLATNKCVGGQMLVKNLPFRR